MRHLIYIPLCIVGAIGGAVLGGVVGSLILLAICQAIVWLTGNDEYMLLMWLGVAAAPVFAFFGGGLGIVAVQRLRKQRTGPAGAFPVIPASDDRGPGR